VKLAIIADVHSNLHALEAISKAIEDSAPDMIVCAGDIVGYGAFPNECCEEVNKLADHTVQGNHDVSALTGDTAWMNPYAAAASNWTSHEMSTRTRSFLGSLKTEERFEIPNLKATMCHGSPTSVEEYVYEEDSSETMLSVARCDLLILGHTHIPFVKRFPSGLIVNPGSVGQPRDRDPRASYALLDSESLRCTVHRVDYDIEAASDAILSAGLPTLLADRLFMGM